MRTNWIILGLALAAIVLIGLLLNRSCNSRLNVTPDAAEQIEKAKQR
jgi:uncharacterized membrane-anchored protein YhcB (DUF1043 family)